MAGSSSGRFVAGLTAAALAVVGYFAYQAAANAPDDLTGANPGSSSPAPSASGAGGNPEALPARSGEGTRVVYSLGRKRVWLVDERDDGDEKVVRTYEVMPSTVDPLPGTYEVTSRTEAVTGSDGAPVEHVVIFTDVAGVVVGFSAAVDGSTAPPDPDKKTGGIRSSRDDGAAMWRFATTGVPVIVVE